MSPISSFRNFTLYPVGPSLDSAAAAEVVTLWTTKAGLPRQEASRRLQELVILVRDPEGRLIGVSTAQQGRVHEGGEEHCFLRMFFQPESRGVRGLAAHVLEVAFDLLASRHALPPAPVGGSWSPKIPSCTAVGPPRSFVASAGSTWDGGLRIGNGSAGASTGLDTKVGSCRGWATRESTAKGRRKAGESTAVQSHGIEEPVNRAHEAKNPRLVMKRTAG